MATPLVSVLMTVYNGERYLDEAIDSVLDQSFRDFEFVIVDDGSSDATPRLLERRGDPRIKVQTIAHAGLIPALNAGVARCTGDFIARMDADDLSRPQRFSRQVEFLEGHNDVDVVTGWSDLIDEQGAVVGRTAGGVSSDMILELASGNQIVHGSVMIRRTALPPEPVYTDAPEDYRLWVRLARAGRRFHAIPEPLYAFRTHGARYSLTHAASQSAGIVDVQWPLLEDFSAEESHDPMVRSKLVRGWGSVAGAAYRAGDSRRGHDASRRFLRLLRGPWNEPIESAADHGIEAIIWGGCSSPQAFALRWRQFRRRPTRWASYKNLLLALPGASSLRQMVRKT